MPNWGDPPDLRHLDPSLEDRGPEDHYRALAELGSDYAYYATVSGGSIRLEWVTGDFEGVTGYSLEEVQTEGGWVKIIDPEDLPLVQEAVERFTRNEEWTGELRLLRPDGSRTWTITAAKPILDDLGTVVGVYGAVHDITEQKRAQQELEEAKALYRNLVEQVPGVVYVAEQGTRGRWHFVGSQIEDLLGYDPQEWLADPNLWFERIHPDDQDWVLEFDATLHLSGGEDGRTIEYRMITREGRVVWVRDAQTFERGDPGGSILIRGILFDVTREKDVADQAHQAQKMEALGQLAGGLAHDFNNLLSVILNYSDLISNDLTDEVRVLEDVAEIRRAAERAGALTKQLLVFSRREPMRSRPVDLNALVRNMREVLTRTIGQDVDLRTELEPDLPLVSADPIQVEQILLNLAINARDAMPQGGLLRISTRTDGGRSPWVELSVRDSGTGMTREVRRRATDPFFTTKPSGQGTGLGLSTVFAMVQRWDGALDISSDPGHGTDVRIRLPILTSEPDPSLADRPRPPTRETSRVLLVDDEEALRKVTSRILEKNGFDVVAVANAAEAIAAIEADPTAFDVVLTDIVMPKMSGIALVKELRERGHAIRAVYMSGYSTDVIESQGEPDGPLIEKPFTAQTLVEALTIDRERSV